LIGSGPVRYPGRRDRSTGFHAEGHPLSKPHAIGSQRKASDTGILSRRLEPGLCPDDAVQQILPEFRKHDAEMLGISVHGVWCHAAFARDCRLHFPLLSDFEPKGEVSQGGTLPIARVKVSPSVAFVLDRQGVIAWSYCSPIAVNPGADEFLTPSRNSQMRQLPTASLKTPITQNDHVRGPALAPITLVEYGDYECPHSAMAHPVVNQLQLHFKGQMRFAFRHFPLTEIHPHAEIAAESTEFAGAAGLFWEMHDALFENQPRLSIPVVFLIAEELRLPETALRNALETGQYRNKVRSDFMGRGDAARRRATIMPLSWRGFRRASPPILARDRSAEEAEHRPILRLKKLLRIDNGQCCFEVRGLSEKLRSTPQERAMVAFPGSQTLPQAGTGTMAAAKSLARATARCSSGWMIWTALAVALAAGPALPQAGVALVKVDLSVVAKGYRMSKLIGSSVINDKNEKIGTLDDIVADKDKKQLSFAVLQIGGFLGLGGRLVVVPYDSLVIDDHGQKITLPGASKDELKKLSEFSYPA